MPYLRASVCAKLIEESAEAKCARGDVSVTSPLHHDPAALRDDASSRPTAAHVQPAMQPTAPAARSTRPPPFGIISREQLLAAVRRSKYISIIKAAWERPSTDGSTRMQQLDLELEQETCAWLMRSGQAANQMHDYGAGLKDMRTQHDRWQCVAQACAIANAGAEGTGCSDIVGVQVTVDEDTTLPPWCVQREAMRLSQERGAWRLAGLARPLGESLTRLGIANSICFLACGQQSCFKQL